MIHSEMMLIVETNLIQAAWAVNFSLPMSAFVDEHIQGLRNILQNIMSRSNNARFLFCSSTASVLRTTGETVQERVSDNTDDSDTIGYSRSKWIAESICAAASKVTTMKNRVAVLRIGQLTGDSQNGVWNMTEAWPLMLSTVVELGCLPRLDERLNWVPVDIAAKAVTEIALGKWGMIEGRDCQVYHIVNPRPDIKWMEVLDWIQETDVDFEIVEPGVWLEKLDKLQNHPARNLFWLWRQAYKDGNEVSADNVSPIFDVRITSEASKTIHKMESLDRIFIQKIWKSLMEEMKSRR